MYRYMDGVAVEMTSSEIEQFEASRGRRPELVRRLVPLAVVMARLEVLGMKDAVLGVLQQVPDARARFLALREGIYADDADARAIFIAAGVDPDVILA